MLAMISKRILIASCCLALPVFACAAKPNSVKVAKDGDTTYFRLQIALPADADDAVTGSSWQGAGTGKFPVMISTPIHETPCYMMTSQENRWSLIKGSDIFYGKTTKKEPLKFRLIYPKEKGGWGEESVEVDLAGADVLASATFDLPNDDNTTRTELSPAQQFAYAQASWFQLVDLQVDDPTGFLPFARLQTLRMAKMPVDGLQSEARRNADVLREQLYATATGARAIQETLQLDRALRTTITTEPRTLELSSVEGVQTKSHPFDEMMKGKQPKFSDLAKLVPADQYMLRFTSVAKLQELADFAQQWGHSLMESPEVGGADAGLRERFQKQICLPSSLLSRLLGPSIVKELAVTGSDPFFREGTDMTLIFDCVSVDIFKAAVDTYWKSALTANPGADIKSVSAGEVAVEKIVTADRTVSAYRAFVGSIAIYSNSLPALQRILATKSKPELSLSAAPDFKYMRAVWPQDPASEDGFLYLSDSFIRRLVGPETKIKSQRRLQANGTMRLVQNAAMLHGFLNGPGKMPALEDMMKSGVLTKTDLLSPDGELKWDSAAAQVSNTVYGRPGFLTPLSEVPAGKVSKSESEEYGTFRDRYQQYWRRYFDPIGVRIKVDKTVSLEAYILPLIDETSYQDLKRMTGDKPAKFDLNRMSTGTLVRWQTRLDPEARELRDSRQMVGGMFGKDSAFTDWIGQWFAVWIEDGELSAEVFRMFADEQLNGLEEEVEPARRGSSGSLIRIFELPIALGVEVKNKLSLAGFLVALQGMANMAAPNLVTFVPQDPYKGSTFVKIAPKPDGEIGREIAREAGRQADSQTTDSAAKSAPVKTPDVALYYGGVGDAWYLSTKHEVLKRLVDAAEASEAKSAVPPRVIDYNAFLVASPGNAIKAHPVVEQATTLLARQSERDKLRQAWLLFRCGLATSADDVTSASVKWIGGEIALPSGGKITYDAATDQPVSSVYGPVRQFKPVDQVKAPNSLLALFDSIAHMRAWLQFTEDGLLTHVEIERK